MRKKIPGFPGYRASTRGNVWSCRATGRARVRLTDQWRKLTPYLRKDGYLVVRVYRKKRRVSIPVQHLVLLAFKGPRPSKDHVCRHFPDRDKMNNRADNLQWGTRAENCADMVSHGTDNRGERQGRSKLTPKKVRAIRKSERTQLELSVLYGVAQSQISRIRRRKEWSWLK